MTAHGIDLTQADTPTPAPSEYWLALGGKLQHDACQGILDGLGHPLDVVSTHRDGSVLLRLRSQMPARERGPLLLRAEYDLRDQIDPGLVLYLEAAQDRNALRKLRGVEVRDA